MPDQTPDEIPIERAERIRAEPQGHTHALITVDAEADPSLDPLDRRLAYVPINREREPEVGD